MQVERIYLLESTVRKSKIAYVNKFFVTGRRLWSIFLHHKLMFDEMLSMASPDQNISSMVISVVAVSRCC